MQTATASNHQLVAKLLHLSALAIYRRCAHPVALAPQIHPGHVISDEEGGETERLQVYFDAYNDGDSAVSPQVAEHSDWRIGLTGVGRELNRLRACGADDGTANRTPSAWMISLVIFLAQRQIVFFVWVTFGERKWSILAERRAQTKGKSK